MAYEDLLSGLVELHVWYQAVHEEIFGLGIREELEENLNHTLPRKRRS
jgi:hypothetical protein